MKSVSFAASVSEAFTANGWEVAEVGIEPSVDDESTPFPEASWIDRVEVRLIHTAGLVGRTMDCILSHDAAGAYGASNQRQESVCPMPTTGPNTGVVVFSIAGYMPQTEHSVIDRLFVWLFLSGAGAYTAEVRVFYNEQTP